MKQVTVEGEFYHKSCFRCAQGGCVLSPSNYAALDGFLYCKHHFSQLFKEKGSYSHVSQSSSLKKNKSESAVSSDQEDSTADPPPPNGDDQPQEVSQ